MSSLIFLVFMSCQRQVCEKEKEEIDENVHVPVQSSTLLFTPR